LTSGRAPSFIRVLIPGNPIKLHQKLHELFNLTAKDFSQWVLLFTTTVNELFHGEKAELAKQRAISIATVMQLKIKQDYRLS
jgi:hemoglobin